MTVVQAARELECSPELVYKLCARGKLGHTRIGFGRGRILISVEQIAAYRLRCEVLPVEDSGEPERERARIRAPLDWLDPREHPERDHDLLPPAVGGADLPPAATDGRVFILRFFPRSLP